MLKTNFIKNKLAGKIFLFLIAVGAGFFFYANSSSGANRNLAPAADFPREALVYAQFRDLPALLKIWDESELKSKYLASENFQQFQSRHLALKLASRWQEFNDALGFEITAPLLSGAAENRAALAIYDIGKMEMVFIAPISAEKFAATMFFQNQEEFEPTELADKTIYYSRAVEADGGRQQQKILFAHVKDRFVLATSENLLLRTLANINRRAKKDSLADEPAFAQLENRLAPHLATVWVNQAKLNEDWYFKRYWVMRNVTALKHIRSGLFDFEMQDNKLIERREFLLAENQESHSVKISRKEAARLLSLVPSEAAFFRLQTLDNKQFQAAAHLRDVIVEPPPAKQPKTAGRWVSYDSFSDDAGNHNGDYSYLTSKFDKSIDEDEQTETTVSDQSGEPLEPLAKDLEQVLSSTSVSSALTAANPQTLEKPLFIRFEKAVVLNLDSPQNLNRQNLENALGVIALSRLTVAGDKPSFSWQNRGDGKNSWRVLELPALRREICYAEKNNALIVANSSRFLQSILTANNSAAKSSAAFDELSVIRLEQEVSAFNSQMNLLLAEENKHQTASNTIPPAADFFAGNISSLLTAINEAKQIEIKRNRTARFLSEEINIYLK